MVKKLLFLYCILIGFNALSQDKKIDQLEVLYSQKYYIKVYRRANKLLANPEYDYSGLPSFYKSMAMFHMAENEVWLKRNPNAIKEAIELYDIFLENEQTSDYIKAHYSEIIELKYYLPQLSEKLNGTGHGNASKEINEFVQVQLSNVKGNYIPKENDPLVNGKNPKEGGSKNELSLRDKIVEYALTFIGVKYVWAGSDPSGFDCSGYTSYVMKKYGISLARTASGQMENATSVKTSNAYKADLIFFGQGSTISHVGLIISDKGEELTMVHASTSKGVIKTNIEQSTYWKPKVKGAVQVI